VLPKKYRLTSPLDFSRATKTGTRVTGRSLVGYIFLQPELSDLPRCGLVVSKSVGGSVTRHRVARAIRHGIAQSISTLPAGSLLVIRALPSAAEASLQEETTSLITALVAKAEVAR
jgi:ribonuclease P protein component